MLGKKRSVSLYQQLTPMVSFLVKEMRLLGLLRITNMLCQVGSLQYDK